MKPLLRTSTAKLSVPSGLTPMFHLTQPPYTLRHAEPEPRRAMVDSWPSNCSLTWYALASV